MAPIDVIIVILLVLGLLSGLRSGFFSAVGTLCGLIAGALVAPWVLPAAAGLAPQGPWRGVVVVGTLILLLALGAGIGSAIGGTVRRGADRIRLRIPERLAGGAFGLVTATLVVSLAGTAIASAGVPTVSSAVASSTVLRTIERITPDPVDEAMARARTAVLDDAVLPTIRGQLDEGDLAAAPDLETSDLDDPALAAAADSVARISGLAPECGSAPSGSGFVVAEDRIVTNAHVVAGVDRPLVELPGQPARDGRVVYFDPVDDLAVIAADVDAAPLPITGSMEPGDVGAVQGYPYGGPFRTVPAGVVTTGPSAVGDIYGDSRSQREVHVLETDVSPGNSGGPLLTEDGSAAGVVFAGDEERADVGYAMTIAELMPVIAEVEGATEAVGTGSCST